MKTTVTEIERSIGCLVVLAVGDAVETTLEFTDRGTYQHTNDMVGGGPFNLKAGHWTDDTSMALCLADSLLAENRLNPTDLCERFVRWWQNGENSCTGYCFDIGNATTNASSKFNFTGNPLAGSDHHRSAGIGSLMRLAPVPIFYSCDSNKARQAARAQSETTHLALECLDACEFYALLLVEAINGYDVDFVLRARQLNLSPNISNIARGSIKGKNRDEIKSIDYVVHTLEAALWAVHNTDSFEEAILVAAKLGHDADTVAAVKGQLSGALKGVSGIPEHWLEKLARRSHIEHLARQLHTRNR